MNAPHNNPHLAAYALGELDTEHARELHDQLRTHSPSAHELEQIEAVTDALRHTAPIPTARLTPEQRHAVLHPAHLPRLVQPMMPRKAAPTRPPSRPIFWSVMGGMLKAAALIALTGAAFFLGKNMPETAPQTAEKAPVVPPKAEKAQQLAATPKPAPQPQPAVEAPKPVIVATTPQKPASVVHVAPQPQIVIKEVIKPAPAMTDLGFTIARGSSAAFASTTKQPASQFSLQPALIRPAPAKRDATALAAPVAHIEKPAPGGKTPDLLIHAWKSEIADCPWNAGHRLLRLVIQLPANQAAVTTAKDAAYPVNIVFDPLTVKQYRHLSERHLPATEIGSAGTQVIWYEFQPNGSSENMSQSGRQIASVTVAGARFTTQPVGPFDSSKLQVLDRGYKLQNARDDFVFESAVVGFGLLMRGAEQAGGLDHQLVLDLAQRSKAGGDSPTSERTRFIRLVQDAQRVIGE